MCKITLRPHSLLIKLISLSLVGAFLIACGSAPKDVDRDGLRDRADQETSQVK